MCSGVGALRVRSPMKKSTMWCARLLRRSAENAAHWSVRSVAEATGMSRSCCPQNLRQRFVCTPHITREVLACSADPFFTGKARDVTRCHTCCTLKSSRCGVWCCVQCEKTQTCALSPNGVVLADDACGASRSAAATTNPSGTTKAHAALDAASGKGHPRMTKRHRAKEVTRVFSFS